MDGGRARLPDETGRAMRPDGVGIAYEVFGSGVVIEGADHMIPGRHPVEVNLLIRDFIDSISGGVP